MMRFLEDEGGGHHLVLFDEGDLRFQRGPEGRGKVRFGALGLRGEKSHPHWDS